MVNVFLGISPLSIDRQNLFWKPSWWPDPQSRPGVNIIKPNNKFYPLELPRLLNRQYRQTKNQTYAVIFEKYNVRYDDTNSHIARSATPGGVDTEDPFTNDSKNCIAVGVRDYWKVACLEGEDALCLKSEDRTDKTMVSLCPLRPLIMCT